MTIKVYEVDRYGCVRVVRPKAEVVPVATVETSAAYPACQCLRCRSASTADSYRTWLTHTYYCPACRTGAPCLTAGRLGRMWRESRR